MADILRISLLGRPLLERGGEEIVGFSYRKSLALLYYLALTPGAHSRHFLAGLLWSEMPDANARAALSRSLSDLRKRVEPFLEITAHHVAFNREAAYWLDAAFFERVVRAALADEKAADALPDFRQLREAVALYRGDLLEGFYVPDALGFEEVVTIARERLHILAVQALERLVKHDVATGTFHRGMEDASRLLALEPTHEATHAQLMLLLARNGQRSAALSQYESCREILKTELGLTPSVETTTLYERIVNGEIGDGYQMVAAPVVNWGDAPTLMPLHGRAAEMAQLRRWIVAGDGRLVAILGMGGQGKTALAATFARSFASDFDVILWQTLLNAPPLTDVVQDWLERLAPERAAKIPQNLDGKLDLLFGGLRQHRCLLILDNVESVMQGGQQAGAFREGYEAYEQLLRRMGLGDHRSCLLLTSREKPMQFAHLERQKSPVFSLGLGGLETTAGRAILKEEHLEGSAAEMERLVRQYSGNPLALILIADTVQNLYGGRVADFLDTESTVFVDIQAVLDQQFGRLTQLEEQIVLWLAVEREPRDIPALTALIHLPHTQANLLVALRSLQRRSLVERRVSGFTLQNVLMEYATEYLVSAVVEELFQGQPRQLARLPLSNASAMVYIRHAQERLLLQPVAEQLLSRGGRAEAIGLLKRVLGSLTSGDRQHGYAAANILNLLLALGVNEPLDFSGAAVWQVYVRGKVLPPIDFSGADLSGSAFTDYGGYILKLAFSPDGSRLAGSAISGEVRVWDVTTRQPLLTLDGHEDFAGALCFSPDGHFLASGGGDGSACLWDAETGRRLRVFPAHDNAIRPVVYAPDGSWVAGASFNRLSFWDPVSGERLFDRAFAEGYVEALAVSYDGQTLAFSNQLSVQFWDLPATLASGSERLLHAFPGEQKTIRRMAFSPDGRFVASCGDRVCIRDAGTGELLRDLPTPNGRIESMAFHPEGGLLAGGGANSIVLWALETGEVVRSFAAHEETVVSLAFAPDGEILVSSSEDHTVRLWDLGGQNLYTIQGYVNMIHGVDVSADGRFLACGSDDRKVRLWDFERGEVLAVLDGHQSRVHCALFSPDGGSVVASSRDRLVRVWAVPSGEEHYRLPTGRVPYHALAWAHDGRRLATGDREGAMAVWDAATGDRLRNFRHDSMVCAVAFHPNDRLVAAVCFDQKITVWDLESGRCVQTFQGHDNEVWALDYSRDGRFLVSGSDDCTVRFWDVATGEGSYVLAEHDGWIQALAFNKAGTVLLTGSQDRTVGVWDVSQLGRGRSPRLLRMLEGHRARVTDVCFTPDETTIVSSSLDETLRLWDAHTGKCREVWTIPGPYAGMDVRGATGLTEAQRRALASLGAIAR